jgi:cysteine desulfurase/selenocysteine lyase
MISLPGGVKRGNMDSQPSLEIFRCDFPSLNKSRNGFPPIYLDNACTTLVPRQVIAAQDEYYTDFPACGGRRSHHWFAEEVNARIEGNLAKGIKGSRQAIAEFINAGSANEIIFTLNTTYAINTVALGLKFKPGDTVLLTDREHNSNLLPWLRLQKTGVIRIEYIPADKDGTLDLEQLETQLKENRVRLVTLAWTSNVTGVTLPAKEIIALSHKHGALVLLDGAQTVPHHQVDIRVLDVDFLVFSLHKMCGPRGVGVLYARKDILGNGSEEWGAGENRLEPAFLGGGTVDDSTYDAYRLLEGPERFEAGIQNYSGLVASKAAVDYLQNVGMERICAHEETLNEYLTSRLLERYSDNGWFHIIGPADAARRAGILTFEVHRPNAVGISSELDQRRNIMIRDGVFCVHSYFNALFGPGWLHPRSHHEHRMIYRVSSYFYNTLAECDVFLDTLDEIFRERSYIL